MPNKIVRVGLHLQMLKFGPVHDPTKPNLEDNVKDVATVSKARLHHISRIGVDLSYAENRALFAVQKLLDDTDYKGNLRPVKLPHGNPYKMKGNQPVLDVKIPQYLEAYGVRKKKTSRQKNEFSAQGRRTALDALESLASKYFLLSYEREVYDKKKKGVVLRKEAIETVDRLIELKRVDGHLVITPSPIMFDQQETYYMILPADLYTVIVPDKQKSKMLFIEYIFYHYEKQRVAGGTKKYEIIRHMETIAEEIGLGNLIKTRQQKKLRSTLNEYYEIAKQQGYLVSYQNDAPGARYPKVDKLQIRVSTMGSLRKVALV